MRQLVRHRGLDTPRAKAALARGWRAYTRAVRATLTMRNAVCLSSLTAEQFDLAGFERGLALGAIDEQVRVSGVAFTEWRVARLQILPDRVQLGFREGAPDEVVAEALRRFFRRARELAPSAPLGINAALQLEREEGEPDPSLGVFDPESLAARLGGHDARGGIALVFNDDHSRWWVELSPLPDDDRLWQFDFNRQFQAPAATDEDAEQVIDWFLGIDVVLEEQFKSLTNEVEK